MSLTSEVEMGSTGDPPVPSGDPPDGTGGGPLLIRTLSVFAMTSSVSLGGSPSDAGESPAPPVGSATGCLILASGPGHEVGAELVVCPPAHSTRVEVLKKKAVPA